MPDTTEKLAVAVAQFAPGANKDANLVTVRNLATEAAALGAKLVVFPEYSSHFVPELGREVVEAAEPIDGPFATALGALAKVLGIHIVAGMVERTASADRISNTVIAVDQHGERVAKYRKMHLYDAFGQKESDWVVAGDIETPETFDVDGITVGIQTCYD